MPHPRSLTATVAVVSMLLAFPAAAQLKVGYVDLQRALGEVEEGRQAQGGDQQQRCAPQRPGQPPLPRRG